MINVAQYTEEQVVDLIMLALQAKAGDTLQLPVAQQEPMQRGVV